VQFGLMANGAGLAAIISIFVAIGTGRDQDIIIFAVHGNIATMATDGIADVGTKMNSCFSSF
jgi:hypothetical protein